MLSISTYFNNAFRKKIIKFIFFQVKNICDFNLFVRISFQNVLHMLLLLFVNALNSAFN